MASSITTNGYLIDVTDQTFATEVLERSKTVPVVVDFWAAWCGPCRMLGPVLEKLASEYQGKFILAKVDVDSNPNVAMQFGIRGIPAVKAFYNSQVVNEFTGALPEPQVRQFIDGLVPSNADLLAKQGYDWEMSGQLAMAVTNYQAALAEKRDHYVAMVGLGRVLLKQGELEAALSLLDQIPAGVQERSIADALIATAQFRQFANGYTEADLRAKVGADANDVASRYALASLLAMEERYPEAMDEFLEIIRRDRKYNDDGARKAMLALFTVIGEDHAIIQTYRRKLANVLF
jgi:putative thioredoxin